MAELKTKKNNASVEKFLNTIKDEEKRKDAFALMEIMNKVTGEDPKMWGSSIVGYGEYHYKYASGREGDWMVTGFSPRKQSMTVYFCGGLDSMKEITDKLGKYKTGKGCLYFNSLADIDVNVLKQMVKKNKTRIKEIMRQKSLLTISTRH